jgi:ABC-type bacteriocin/lantibiotic exporter with double-glycine peptidase domain
VLGRQNFSETTDQADGYGWAVPYVRQRHANMCGDACVQMLSLYYGWGINIEMTTNPRGVVDGLELEGSAYASRFERVRGLTTAAGFEDALKRYGPLMCSGVYAMMGMLGDQGHWVVVKGADSTNFYLHDPWHGANVQRDKDWFIDRLEKTYRPLPS